MNKDVKFRSILEGDDSLGRYLLKRLVHDEVNYFLKNFDATVNPVKIISWKKSRESHVLSTIHFVYKS